MTTVIGTDLQLRTLDALVETGSQKLAAERLGCSPRAVHDRMQRLRDRNGNATTLQLAYWHRRTVWDVAA